MSWLDEIQGEILITTGDGKTYSPAYKISPLSDSFNISEFDFPNVEGTKVDRKEIKGFRKTVELYFQGPDHLEDVKEFRESSKDKRFWIVSFPVFGTFNVQPASIEYDPSRLGSTKVTVTLLETITEDNPRATVGPREQAAKNVEQATEASNTSFSNQVTVGSSDITLMTNNVSDIYADASTQINLTTEANEYFNLFNDANSKVVNALAAPLPAITAINAMIMYPSLFSLSVRARLNILSEQFTGLYLSISNLITPNEKKIFENNAGVLVNAMINTVLNPLDDSDFENNTDVFDAINTILTNYNTYIVGIDSLQSDNGGDENSYIPDFDFNWALYNSIYNAVSQLYIIALSSRQERIEYLDKDENLIEVTHRFYGLEPDDSTIQEFIRINSVGNNEYLEMKKGRKIIYFV